MKKVFILSLLLYTVFSVTAQSEAESKLTGTLLWKISGKDLTKSSYILGTHHLTDISFIEKIHGFKGAFDACEVVVGELDLRDKDQLAQAMQQSMIIEEGEKGYKDLLTDEEYKKLEADIINYLGMPLEPFLAMKPALLSTILALKLYSYANPHYNPTIHQSIDEYVQRLAIEEGKPVKGLETIQDQTRALFSDPIEDQLNELRRSLSEVELGIELTKQLTDLYEKGDLNGLYTLAFDETKSESACPMEQTKKHSIVDNRNTHWLKELPQLLKENSSFIAVGALHLAGEEGLLFQLQEMGYTVEAVK